MKPKVFFYSGGQNLWIVVWTLLIGSAVIAAAGAWGLAQVAARLVPLAGQAAVLALGLFAVVVVPLSLVKTWRLPLARLALWIGAGYGLGIWMVAFLTLWKWLRFASIPFLFLPFLAGPAAILRLLYLSDTALAGGIFLAWVIERAIRSYGMWLAAQALNGPGRPDRFHRPNGSGEGEVIDTVVVDVKETPRLPGDPGDQG